MLRGVDVRLATDETAALAIEGEVRGTLHGILVERQQPGIGSGFEDGDTDGAVLLSKLNLEFHPDSAQTHLMLAQLYARHGDQAQAIASAERALELEPDNRWAKQMLERLRSPE